MPFAEGAARGADDILSSFAPLSRIFEFRAASRLRHYCERFFLIDGSLSILFTLLFPLLLFDFADAADTSAASLFAFSCFSAGRLRISRRLFVMPSSTEHTLSDFFLRWLFSL